MTERHPNLVVVLGPTASGKTRLGVHIAHTLDGEVISADSRQVYRGLDIGSGKDLHEYQVNGQRVHHHLIDVADVSEEFHVFAYQRAFADTFNSLHARGVWPVLVGGTGLYLEAALARHRFIEVPEDAALRAELATFADDDLRARLRCVKPDLHNTTDLDDRARMIRAIEIAVHSRDATPVPMPDIHPLILGTRWDREELHLRIATRLRERLDSGLLDEVGHLRAIGVASERLHALGLEYRYVNDFLEGHIHSRNDLQQKLAAAIAQFAKRQETWFRRMERRGHTIHWIDRADPHEAMRIVAQHITEPSRP